MPFFATGQVSQVIMPLIFHFGFVSDGGFANTAAIVGIDVEDGGSQWADPQYVPVSAATASAASAKEASAKADDDDDNDGPLEEENPAYISVKRSQDG